MNTSAKEKELNSKLRLNGFFLGWGCLIKNNTEKAAPGMFLATLIALPD